jgi:hypothetical protein
VPSSAYQGLRLYPKSVIIPTSQIRAAVPTHVWSSIAGRNERCGLTPGSAQGLGPIRSPKKHWPPARRELRTVDTLQQGTRPLLQYGAKVKLRCKMKRVRERRERREGEKLC